MVARRMSWFAVALPLLGGCMVEQSEFVALRDQVRLQQRQINDLKARQDEQGLRVDTLNNGFKILGDKAEENAARIDELEQRGGAAVQTPAPAPLTAPAPAAPAASAAPAPEPVPEQAPVPAAEPAPAATEGPLLLTNRPSAQFPEEPAGGEIITAAPRAEKLYAGALALYSGRDYQQAAAKFEEFVATYPDHKLAGNAQYWIGECHYSQRRFSEAAEAFDRVEKNFPASPKVPAALLKKGLSLAELKQMPEARAALQRILERYAQSEEAAKARDRLDRWKKP